jgi:hypothetical protein
MLTAKVATLSGPTRTRTTRIRIRASSTSILTTRIRTRARHVATLTTEMCVLPTRRRPWQPRCGLCLADLDGDSLNPDPGEPGVDAFSPNAKVGKSDSCSDRPDAGPAASDADTYNLNRDPDEPDVDPASLNPASDGRALDAGKPNVNPGNHILDPVSLDAGCVESAAEPARPNDPSAPPKWRPARVIRPWVDILLRPENLDGDPVGPDAVSDDSNRYGEIREWGAIYSPTVFITPRKTTVPDNRSLIANTKGRSTTIASGPLVTPIPTAVAAAASVPSSFTSTNVFCSTRLM